MSDNDVYFHFLEYQGARAGVEYDPRRANFLSDNQVVNEYGMQYGFVAGQLYVANWDISPEGQTGQYNVEVPMNLFSAEMTAKKKQVDEYEKKAAQFRLDVERYNYIE